MQFYKMMDNTNINWIVIIKTFKSLVNLVEQKRFRNNMHVLNHWKRLLDNIF